MRNLLLATIISSLKTPLSPPKQHGFVGSCTNLLYIPHFKNSRSISTSQFPYTWRNNTLEPPYTGQPKLDSQFNFHTRQFNSTKNNSSNNSPIFFDSAKYLIPYPAKKNNGDDAALCTAWHLAVADGVGSWGFSGIDPGQYSRELIDRISFLIKKGGEIPQPLIPPISILKDAYRSIQSIGSSTCCLVFLDSLNMKIMTANLGDSGFILYRPSLNKVICRSEFQSHDFNYPLQLGTGSLDGPSDAEQLHFPVLVDDWIILGTDGLWDNLYEQQIIDLILKSRNCSSAAQAIAKSAFKFSIDRNWNSPFSSREREYMGCTNARIGGKPDDISVVVAQIRQAVIPLEH